jgi:hypothetical protein
LRAFRGTVKLRSFPEKRGEMSIPIPLVAEGTRVKVKRARVPQDPAVTGRTGTVVNASEYRTESLGVLLDGEQTVRQFMPDELEVTEIQPLPPEREAAKQRRSLP